MERHDLEPRVRLATALGLLPDVEGGPLEGVARWLVEVDGHKRLEVGADLTRLDAVIGGPSSEMMTPLGEHLGMVDASEDDLARARALGMALDPPGVAMWLEGSPRGLAAGYGLLGNFPLAAVVAVEPLLPAAFAELGLDELHEVGASAGLAHRVVTARAPVPMERSVEQIVGALAEQWDVEGFDSELLSALTGGRPGAEVHLVLSEGGLVAFGVSVDDVDLEALVRLVDLCGGDADGLARFEGALGAEQRGATLWRDADGVRVCFGYELG